MVLINMVQYCTIGTVLYLVAQMEKNLPAMQETWV